MNGQNLILFEGTYEGEWRASARPTPITLQGWFAVNEVTGHLQARKVRLMMGRLAYMIEENCA